MFCSVATFLFTGLLLTTAYSTIPTPEARQASADALAAARGWQSENLPADQFELAVFAPRQWQANERLTIYIEDDGLAWVTGTMPSADPTPRDPLALRLALAQPSGNVAYLGRPCQYVVAARSNCSQGLDRVIPPALAQRWPAAFLGPQKGNLRIMPAYDHTCCWAEHWPALLN